jgi:hypothetical protein
VETFCIQIETKCLYLMDHIIKLENFVQFTLILTTSNVITLAYLL